MRLIAASLACTALLYPLQLLAAPGDMSAADFLTRADKLKAKGPMALLSSDFKHLKGEAEAAGASYRARLKADKAAGHPPHRCPPRKAAMNSDELLAHLRSYPEARRPSITMKVAFAELMRKKYPCA